MGDPTLPTVLEAVRQLSTEIVFLLIMALMVKFFLAVVFSLDVLAILLAALLRRYAEHHMTMRPMAQRLLMSPPYSRGDRKAVFAVFLRGMEASDIRMPPSPPRPPGP